MLRLKLPKAAQDKIKDHYTDGDYAEISRQIFGTNEFRSLIKNVIENKEGRERVINGIVKFYNKKANAVKKLS